EDVPIIQALAVRLLGGQNSEGMWTYACPPLGPQDVRQMNTLIKKQSELKAKGELPKATRDPVTRPGFPKEVQSMVARTKHNPRAPTARLDGRTIAGDNSNTQFAILGLWVARRHGAPVDKALAQTAAHFRGSQNADGGWG